MKKIGIVLPNLGPTQLAFSVINEINKIVPTSQDSYFLFYEDLVPYCTFPLCAIMNVVEIWPFDGLLIGSTLDTTSFIINSMNSSKKVFYVWDLEWIRGKNNFIENITIYRNPNIKLYTRSNDYKKAIENYTNRNDIKVIENFNLTEIINDVYQPTR